LLLSLFNILLRPLKLIGDIEPCFLALSASLGRARSSFLFNKSFSSTLSGPIIELGGGKLLFGLLALKIAYKLICGFYAFEKFSSTELRLLRSVTG
jgi:hypothetical protein